MIHAHPADGSDHTDSREDTSPHVNTPHPREISLRAYWVDSLTPAERDGLPDLPLRVVEEMFTEWRRRTHADE